MRCLLLFSLVLSILAGCDSLEGESASADSVKNELFKEQSDSALAVPHYLPCHNIPHLGPKAFYVKKIQNKPQIKEIWEYPSNKDTLNNFNYKKGYSGHSIYDNCGNLLLYETQSSKDEYSYDDENRLIQKKICSKDSNELHDFSKEYYYQGSYVYIGFYNDTLAHKLKTRILIDPKINQKVKQESIKGFDNEFQMEWEKVYSEQDLVVEYRVNDDFIEIYRYNELGLLQESIVTQYDVPKEMDGVIWYDCSANFLYQVKLLKGLPVMRRTYLYNIDDLTVTETSFNDNIDSIKTVWKYTDFGDLIETRQQDENGNWKVEETSTYAYDAFGNIIHKTIVNSTQSDTIKFSYKYSFY